MVFSFVLVSDSTGDDVLREDVALKYDPIGAVATCFNGLKGAISELNQNVIEINLS